MAIEIDYKRALADLTRLFNLAELDYAAKSSAISDGNSATYAEQSVPGVSQAASAAAEVLFSSDTKSYRETLLGCALVRLQNHKIDIRVPYANQSPSAFNGRSFDEIVINPFLQGKEIPAGKGPYLAVFRRSIRFIPETAAGLRDKAGYAAMLTYLDELEATEDENVIEALIRLLLFKFVQLRDKARIALAKIERLSLAQYEWLIDQLLQTKSGGLLPVLLTVAMFRTIKACHNLPWEIEWQGINVADKASGASGDITLRFKGEILLAIEVTERTIDESRVVSTFNTKIVKNAIHDYLFLTTQRPSNDATATAKRYFAQGHEMSFLEIHGWLINILGTIGATCRKQFTDEFLVLLETEASAAVKVRWNALIKGLFSG